MLRALSTPLPASYCCLAHWPLANSHPSKPSRVARCLSLQAKLLGCERVFGDARVERVKTLTNYEHRGDALHYGAKPFGFSKCQRRSSAPVGLAIAKPLLDDGVAAELIIPGGYGHVGDEGLSVEVEIAGSFAERFRTRLVAAKWARRPAAARAAPITNRQCKVYTAANADLIVEAALDAGDAIDAALYAPTKQETVRYWQKVFGPSFQV